MTSSSEKKLDVCVRACARVVVAVVDHKGGAGIIMKVFECRVHGFGSTLKLQRGMCGPTWGTACSDFRFRVMHQVGKRLIALIIFCPLDKTHLKRGNLN